MTTIMNPDNSSSSATQVIASLSAMNELQSIAQQVETKTNYLMSLKDGIENMPVIHQIEILRILHNKQTQINENKNGVFVNISFLPKETITELAKYVRYVGDQESVINTVEHQKQEFKNTFFDSDIVS
jgi:hypothetical protein